MNNKLSNSMLHTFVRIVFLLVGILLSACSTTRNLPEDETLYIGQKKLLITGYQKTSAGELALEEIRAALATPPNNALLGSSTLRIPLPVGLWIYNGYVHSETKLGKYIFRKFAAKPVYISSVNPDIRIKAATNLLHDYGYFDGTVSYTQIPTKNPRKAKLQYSINMPPPCMLDTITYQHFPPPVEKLFMEGINRTVLKPGAQFNVVQLDEERDRLSTLLRNRGYHYFRPDFINYRADTTQISHKAVLQITPKSGLPPDALRPCYIGSISVDILDLNGDSATDSLIYNDLLIRYRGKLKVRPAAIAKRIRLVSGGLFSERRHTRTQAGLAELGIFRYSEIQYTPRDSASASNYLNACVKTSYDLLYDSELELNIAAKSNDQAGPSASYAISRRNVFGGGETFSIRLRGAYEWQTGRDLVKTSDIPLNSYELGLSGTLTIPGVMFSKKGNREYDYPTAAILQLNAGLLNRARFFKMLSFGGETSYTFQPARSHRHTITPFKLTFNALLTTTPEFREITAANPVLFRSLENQFIPLASYTYTYNNISPSPRSNRNTLRIETTFASAGNVTSGVYKLFGKSLDERKELFGAPFAQFLKLTGDIRYTWKIDRNQSIATRLAAGIIYSYGNSTVSPYSEQFYVGGANSIRAFTVRSIGPGSYHTPAQTNYTYMDQTGDLKLESNIEYRFRLLGNLHGALFLDAGNIWLLRNDLGRPGSGFSIADFGEEIALGTGAGLRYDLSVLVVRLDCGVALHTPYASSRKGYYNIPKFNDGLGLHLAVGYPF